MKSARRRSREFALQGLYQWRVSRNEPDAVRASMAEATGFDRCDIEYFGDLFGGVTSRHAELDALIEPLIDRKLAELSPVEHSVLRIGAYELAHRPDVPYRAIINEAVELAKSFGGTDGHKYVNGVLDKLAPRVRPAETAEPRRPARKD